MKTRLALWGLVPVLCAGPPSLAEAAPGQTGSDVTLESASLRVVIGADGTCRSVWAKPVEAEYGWAGQRPGAAFSVRAGEGSWPASRVRRQGDTLVVEFGRSNVTATLKLIPRERYIALRLEKLEGPPVDSIRLLQLRLKPLPQLGRGVNVAYDDQFGICLCAGNVRTDVGLAPPAGPKRPYVTLSATAHREPALIGGGAVRLPEPQRKFPRCHGRGRTRLRPAARGRVSQAARLSVLVPVGEAADAGEHRPVHPLGQTGRVPHDPLLVHGLLERRRALRVERQLSERHR
ncbi:MAG TPA: hypothetical protein EYP56_14055 [Planctomycetaceae bacterium]|nr:hypothetical protein [Planctomycetaceae bacterium]